MDYSRNRIGYACNMNGTRCAAQGIPSPDRAGAFVDIFKQGKKWFNPIFCASNQLPKTERAERRAVLIATNAELVLRELSVSGLDSRIT